MSLFLINLCPTPLLGQIKIGGNVYGGGNHAEVRGSTKVTVKAGDIGAVLDPNASRPLADPQGRVFGGARMANVGGNTFVHIDGESDPDGDTPNYILVNQVYGGNDIAGTIGTAKAVKEGVPSELTAVLPSSLPEGKTKDDYPKLNDVDDEFNSYVRVSTKISGVKYTADQIAAAANDPEAAAYGKTTNDYVPAEGARKVYIGQLFAGGNGDFEYPEEQVDGEYVIKQVVMKDGTPVETIIARSKTPFVRPELDKTYMEVVGGSIVYAYGGGNNATVKEQNIIHIDNPSAVVNHIYVDEDGVEDPYATAETETIKDLLSTVRFKEMGINTGFSKPSSGAYQVGRFFGGNNKAEMSIRPTWNLLAGKVRNLYSGGNKGNMTSSEGLLLEIPTYSSLIVDNLYGGCRMADVMPTKNGIYTPCTNLTDLDREGNLKYKFPNELAARTLVRGGHINNVYGGNDVTGSVYGGNAIGIYTTVYGNVYGGGNGDYPYTDSQDLENDDIFGDFYYTVPSGMTSSQALNAFRPNAEQVSIRLKGDGSGGGRPNYTVIQGSVYLGGNCATLVTKKKNPMVELKIGSYVIADNVFLGNNGEGMIDENYLKIYAGQVDENGKYVESGGTDFSSLDLTDASVFRRYMTGAAMPLKPSIVFDKIANGDPDNYEPFTSFIGSFYCGGNVGSMTIEGKETFTIDQGVNIYEKFVGGCNKADVAEGTYHAAYQGGVIGTEEEQAEYGYVEGGKIKDRIEINLENMTITPLRWNDNFTQLKWNTNKWGYVYTALEAGDKLEEGDVYYASNPYTEHTVTGSAHTVTKDDNFFKKLDNKYISYAIGTELPVDSKYYTLTGTKNTVTDAGGYTAVGGEYLEEQDFVEDDRNPSDHDLRLLGGNVYGGCYESGHVNGNIVININQELLNRDKVFGTSPDGVFGNPASGVELEDQRDDLMAVALSVFGAGYGEDTEVWGSTTVNHNNGYAFQIYGGGQAGVVGKQVDTGGEKKYVFNKAYSSTVNLKGDAPVYSSDTSVENLAETEYIYGGGNEGDVCGNTLVNLGNGRIYDAFGGASDADILGHAEVYIGRQPNNNGIGYRDGFPWIKDIVYGGNDFGGTIYGEYESGDGEEGYNFQARIKDYDATKAAQLHGTPSNSSPGVLKSASYVEYLQGRVDTIYGGSYGYYDYVTEYAGSKMPFLENSFVNIRPKAHDANAIKGIFGGGTGYPKNRKGDESQDHSYVLVDIPDGMKTFSEMEVFGAGSYNGLGMREEKEKTFAPGFDRDKVSAIIDLLHGEIGNAYGGSFREGNTCRTVVNVPAESTIKIKNIFGGAYGLRILPPCDVIQSIVNYNNTSENALVTGAIYGGNNNQRRTIFTNVNISSPVWSNKEKGYLATVYGAGKGFNSWSEHTNVELLSGAKVYEVYGGGEMGHVLNAETVQKYMQNEKAKPSVNICAEDPWKDPDRWTDKVGGTLNPSYKTEWDKAWKDAWSLGDYYVPNATFDNYFNTFADLRNTSLVRKAEIDERDYSGYTDEEKEKRQYIYNTNVIINEGAEVVNYAYGGGYGSSGSLFSGDVWGHTYIALLGGKVKKDIYAAGTAGAVDDAFAQTGAYYYNTKDPNDTKNNPYGFTASATAYIKGGTCRNVYGGGWEGNVGVHSKIVDGVFGYADISDSPAGDKPGETYVVVGDLDGSSFTEGIPAIQRNVYGGGEGGAVYGTAHVKLNNGYVGYEYKYNETSKKYEYVEKTEDDTKETPNKLLEDAGCLFGGGYIDNSTVDKTKVIIKGGTVRNSVFGGGEIAAIGRGDMKEKPGGTDYELKGIYRPGKTNVIMYGGHVHRNVFGGGRGYDNLTRHGSLHDDGFVFGQTEVRIHGGEIGTNSGVADGDGNVFGGGDVGIVYSAYEKPDGSFGKGVKDGVRYDGSYEGYYYQHAWTGENQFVTVEVPTYYTAAEADKYNSDNSLLTPSSPGYKKEGDQKGTKTERQFTEDCKVLVEPMLKVTDNVTIDGTSYTAGQFVPIEKLNKLKDKNTDAAKWDCLDQTGIIIHNAVFAGGNAHAGSITTGANTNTVFGNATASINDIYHRDMITLGTRHTGGLYGDGNLTLVDGYRELNITNYGTDYYSIAKEIDINTYHDLPEREAAYYELNYTCMKECKDKHGTTYLPADPETPGSKATTITADDMLDFFLVYNDETKKYESFVYGGKAVLSWNSKQETWEPNSDAGYWKESGVLPVYAGRLMNSIQRADLCGVFGSRMVMQGAQDRVPEEADYTNYTINRVREVSLNKMDSKITSDQAITEDDPEYYKKHTHGNYFGIYNVVNYLGSLTSDVHFTDVRKTDNTTNNELYKRTVDGKPYLTATFYDWKKENIKNKTRNNGASHNKVALASGVYLELTTEESTGDGLYEKVWGPITGIVELDLINVSTGIGGGFVYAKNVHGIPSKTWAVNTTLTALNKGAATKWDYQYDTTDDADHQKEWESSGNFVHSTQTIIDDCYNVSNRYYGDGKMPAHFWYIKGSTYVYDQYISAYTGQSNAFSEVVDIPLTIAAASHGKMKLLNVMPNLYAYYANPGVPLGDDKKMIINGKTYYKNDPISYWDWYLLSNYEKDLFVEKTYVNCVTVNIDDEIVDGKRKMYEPGTLIMTDTEFATYKSKVGGHTYTNAAGEVIKDADDNIVNDDYIFRESNNVGHDKGYILTYEVNNPSQWDNWYTPKSNEDGSKITLAAYGLLDASGKAKYEDGPTYRLKTTTGGAVLGQSEYQHGDLIPETIYYTYEGKSGDSSYPGIKSHITSSNGKQATFEKAYIVKNKITISGSTSDSYYNVGTTVSESFRNDSHQDDCEEAYICTKTIELTKEKVIYKDSKMKKSEAEGYVTDVKSKMGNTYKEMTLDEIKALTVSESLTAEKKKELITLATLRDDLKTNLVQAYYCTSKDKSDDDYDGPYYYGGNYYESGHNYRGLEAWSSMSKTDRDQFTFNYDALDLLIDPNYTTATSGAKSEGQKYQYDSAAGTLTGAEANDAHYSLETSVDYTAEYNSDDDSETLTNKVTVKHSNGTTESNVQKLTKGDELSRDEFEKNLVNEKRHFAPVAVKNATEEKDKNNVATENYLAYVVNTSFQIGSTPYAVGETISSATYAGLSGTEKGYVTEFKFSSTDYSSGAVYYYCRESYPQGTTVTPISSTGEGGIPGAGGGISDGKVQLGTLINSSNYGNLKNEQENFTIHGVSPTETSTLYVSRESDIYDLSKEKIITVIYQYDYDEADTQGNVTPISERHVLNIHLTFKSGVPIVEDITPPDIILPGDFTSIRQPNVTPGAYEVTGGGWELFATQRDAESHTNGVEYNPDADRLYWYQDEYYVAYYAKSYLGRTYSNAVPVSVANYHDLADVMSDEYKSHHMYIDHKNVKRYPKIYINDYSASDKNGLDIFKNLYDLSLRTSVATEGALKDHALLDNKVKGGKDLEFFLRTDIDYPDNPETNDWSSIGTDDECFKGTLHGDGHTISGLDHSLFNNLCGDVYNLGVTGSFQTAGVADKGTGYVESAWIKTSATEALSTKPYAVFGNPSYNKDYQVVNSYFLDDNKGLFSSSTEGGITTSGGSRGKATALSAKAFYNGELAYDLNNFYLYKRYSDQKVTSGTEKQKYSYFTIGDDGNLELQNNHYYEAHPDLCSTGYEDNKSNVIMYVEDRFADGDFRYAAGVIPETEDERFYSWKVNEGTENETVESCFFPIWPDDYIFFGQKLTYDWAAEAHQDVPTAVARDGGRLSTGTDANRVYRAPAYYRSKDMGIAHFNPHAYLAQTRKDVPATKAYPNMTAIDFAGHNGGTGTYALGQTVASGGVPALFYPPLLDDDGLLSIRNCDETQNLLVYAPSADDNAKTYGVLTSYFQEPEFNAYWDRENTEDRFIDEKVYDRVIEAPVGSIHGHLVQNNLTAIKDQLLVDYNDFNAPISYSFDAGSRMWYQRLPLDKEFVDLTQGWQGISIPFTAELVTTDTKGEITHFYNDGGKNAKGHEYWLRELEAESAMTLKSGETDVLQANFQYLAATDNVKTFSNTFLWDYYYKNEPVHNQKDKNDDTYLEYKQYYNSSHDYKGYPLLAKATPYILGLPGKTYYEFDLSGKFGAENTAVNIPKLGKQVITFASNEKITVGVSDDEMTGTKVTYGGNNYYFKPSYMNESLTNGNFVMNSDGDAYVQLNDGYETNPGVTYADAGEFATAKAAAVGGKLYTDEDGKVEAVSWEDKDTKYYSRVSNNTKNEKNQVTASLSAFRPYFTISGTGSSPARSMQRFFAKKIVFGGADGGFGEGPESVLDGSLEIYTRGYKIYTTSHMKEATTIRIVNAAGATITNYVLQPGETIETPVAVTGVYVVNKKKVFVE